MDVLNGMQHVDAPLLKSGGSTGMPGPMCIMANNMCGLVTDSVAELLDVVGQQRMP